MVLMWREDKGDEEDLGLLTPETGQDSRCLRVSELLKCSVQTTLSLTLTFDPRRWERAGPVPHWDRLWKERSMIIRRQLNQSAIMLWFDKDPLHGTAARNCRRTMWCLVHWLLLDEPLHLVQQMPMRGSNEGRGRVARTGGYPPRPLIALPSATVRLSRVPACCWKYQFTDVLRSSWNYRSVFVTVQAVKTAGRTQLYLLTY